MPRGNDATEAATQLRERYPDSGNIEDLVRASRLGRNSTLVGATLKKVDEEATADLDLDKVAKAVPGDGTVLDAAVRGDHVVYVVERPNGFIQKGVLERKGNSQLKHVDADPDEGDLAAVNAELEEQREAVEKAKEEGDPVVPSQTEPVQSASEKAQAESDKE